MASPLGSWLKQKMLSLDPTFDERNYGSRGFSDFLTRFPHLVEIHRPQGPGDIRVTLVQAGKAKKPR